MAEAGIRPVRDRPGLRRTLFIYRRLVGARIRADWQYRTSFVLFLLGQFMVALSDFAAIAVIFAAVDDLAPDLGQHHLARPAFDQDDAELTLEILDLHRQRGLRHRAGLRRLAEVTMLRQQGQIAELSEGDHSNKII